MYADVLYITRKVTPCQMTLILSDLKKRIDDSHEKSLKISSLQTQEKENGCSEWKNQMELHQQRPNVTIGYPTRTFQITWLSTWKNRVLPHGFKLGETDRKHICGFSFANSNMLRVIVQPDLNL